MVKFHEPVLLKEAIRFLQVLRGKKYIDATIGGGGHSEEILKKGGQVLGIDCDPEALTSSRKRLVSACPPSASCWKLVKGNFAHLKRIAEKSGFAKVAGIIFDLGLSFHQLKFSNRGFSFDENSFLDMRMDPELSVTAYDLVNGLSQKELVWLFSKFGQERYARRISKAIGVQRVFGPIKTSRQLAQIVLKVVPTRQARIHPATRCFQALRIAVNNELGNLENALPQAVELLEKKGRLVVISFHSLEDRIVKNFFKGQEKRSLVVLTKKPIKPSQTEVLKNPRSRSARLRAAEKKQA